MVVVVWVAEGVWEAAVDAAKTYAPSDAEVVLLHVISEDVEEIMRGAFAGLVGRRRPVPPQVDRSAVEAAEELLAAAARRLNRPARLDSLRGRVEREVVTASATADLLILSRDGDRSRLGPHSIGPVSRFIVDHAACPLLLVWPGQSPPTSALPPPAP